MKKKIGFINAGEETLTVYYDDKAKNNPYRLYLEFYGQDGRHHRKLLQKYANLHSCGIMLERFTFSRNEERR